MEVKSIYAAFVKAQTGFAPALKTNTNPHFKSKYADLAACVEAVIDSLNANGIGLVQKTHQDETGVTVETVFVHDSGESFSGGVLHVPASKQDAQGYGSALSYARRYSLMAACGIAPEDDDGNAAAKKRPEPTTGSLEPLLRASIDQAKAKKGSVADVTANLPPLTAEERVYFDELAADVEAVFKASGQAEAFDRVDIEQLDNEQKIHLWGRLGSKVRAALKVEGGLRIGAS
jgi:hypothetical protein